MGHMGSGWGTWRDTPAPPPHVGAAPTRRGGALTLRAWSFLRSTLARESGRSSSDRNCGDTGRLRTAPSASTQRAVAMHPRTSPHPPHPGRPWSWRSHWHDLAARRRAAWPACERSSRWAPGGCRLPAGSTPSAHLQYSLRARDEVERLVDQRVEVLHLAAGADSEGAGRRAASRLRNPPHCFHTGCPRRTEKPAVLSKASAQTLPICLQLFSC